MTFFKLEPHIADIRLFVVGDDLKDLFTSAYKGLYHIIRPQGCSDKDHRVSKAMIQPVHISSSDTTSLLINFLSEILNISSINDAIYCQLDIINLTATHIDAQLTGHPVDKFAEDIKAVSRHEANVIKNLEGKYETVIIFDIQGSL